MAVAVAVAVVGSTATVMQRQRAKNTLALLFLLVFNHFSNSLLYCILFMLGALALKHKNLFVHSAALQLQVQVSSVVKILTQTLVFVV